jgi:hypothetical protein
MPATGQQTDFDVCHWLADGSKADILLYPVVFVVLVIWYFSTIFLVAAWELWSSYNRKMLKIPAVAHRSGPGRYVAEHTVKQEAEYFRWAGVLTGVCTVSTYSCMTVRGAQALGLLTASVAFVIITLSAFRYIFLAETLTTHDIGAAHFTFLGTLLFTLVGFVQTLPPMGTSPRSGKTQIFRKFNVTFTGACSTTETFGRWIITACHTGGVLGWVACFMAATYLQATDDDGPDNSPWVSLQTMWYAEVATVSLFAVANVIYHFAPEERIFSVPVFVTVFISEVMAFVALSVFALLQEFQPIYNCVNFSDTVWRQAIIILFVGIAAEIAVGFMLQRSGKNMDVMDAQSDTEIARCTVCCDDDYSQYSPQFSRDYSQFFSRENSRLSKTR